MNPSSILRLACSQLRQTRRFTQLCNNGTPALLHRKWEPYFGTVSEHINIAAALKQRVSSTESHVTKEIKPSEGINMRLANENDYLSWMRNGYLCTVIGISMTVHETVPYSEHAGIVFFGLGLTNILLGTSLYQYNLLRYKKEMLMSPFLGATHTTFGMVHVLIWCLGVLIYMYRDPEEEKEKKEIKEKKASYRSGKLE